MSDTFLHMCEDSYFLSLYGVVTVGSISLGMLNAYFNKDKNSDEAGIKFLAPVIIFSLFETGYFVYSGDFTFKQKVFVFQVASIIAMILNTMFYIASNKSVDKFIFKK